MTIIKYMQMKKPSLKSVVDFIYETHQIEEIKISPIEIEQTLQKKIKNVYAHGHLLAIDYTLNNLFKNSYSSYPVKYISNIYDVDKNLYWLKQIHTLTVSPLIEDLNNKFSLSKIGVWRTSTKNNFYIAAPSPFKINEIMFQWAKKFETIHNKVKNKLDSAYGISKQDENAMFDFAEEQPLFFSTVQPFEYCNNRIGRLIENVIRMGWNIPLKSNWISTYDKFKDQLQEYQLKHKYLNL